VRLLSVFRTKGRGKHQPGLEQVWWEALRIVRELRPGPGTAIGGELQVDAAPDVGDIGAVEAAGSTVGRTGRLR